MIASGTTAQGLNVVQLLANIAYLTAGGWGLFKLIDRAFQRKMQEHVAPVMDALTSHMVEEEDGMKALVKGQKKIGKAFEAHAQFDIQRFDAMDTQLARIERQGVDAVVAEVTRTRNQTAPDPGPKQKGQ